MTGPYDVIATIFFLYNTFRQTADKKPKQLFKHYIKPHHRLLQYALLFIMKQYIPQENPTCKVTSHPRTNYIIYMHTAGLKPTSNSLTERVFSPPPTACCSAFWEHISSRLKNQVIPNLNSPALKRYSHHESSNGNHAVEEMTIRLLHGKDGGLTVRLKQLLSVIFQTFLNILNSVKSSNHMYGETYSGIIKLHVCVCVFSEDYKDVQDCCCH